MGHPSSIAQRVLERMDAMLSETDADGRPVAHNRVAGVVVNGNEDGAHHEIPHIACGLMDFGYTIPGQAWTYWNRSPGHALLSSREHGAPPGTTFMLAPLDGLRHGPATEGNRVPRSDVAVSACGPGW
ncbi:hypothetical protein GCM10010393_42160 [Streptomyces gobitricini]|uniref:Uncharacterized protein n=1 Tax=Streptomyces gobitricini TaxID=68211 RepID=A0ABP5ZZQ0_9ACTN